MTIKNNFVSLIALGNFNPAILTPIFLKNECGVDLGTAKGQTTPVASQLFYDKIRFVAELERLEIIETEPGNFTDSMIPGYMDAYLTTLLYTPLFACGVNLNTGIDISEQQLNRFFVQDLAKGKELMSAQEIVVDTQIRYVDDSDQQYMSWTVLYNIEADIVGQLTIRRTDSSALALNYNYEVRGLQKDRSRYEMVVKRYGEIVGRYFDVVRRLTE